MKATLSDTKRLLAVPLFLVGVAVVVVSLVAAGRILERGPFAPSFPGPLPAEIDSESEH